MMNFLLKWCALLSVPLPGEKPGKCVYTTDTMGNLIVNGGNITAKGGYACAGIAFGIITDSPWLLKEDGKLLMFWSGFRGGEYAVGMAESESSSVYGPWRHLPKLLLEKNGGHGMMFEGSTTAVNYK